MTSDLARSPVPSETVGVGVSEPVPLRDDRVIGGVATSPKVPSSPPKRVPGDPEAPWYLA